MPRGPEMLTRVAEDVLWMSRYVERAIAVGRLIEVTWHLELDVGDADESYAHFWRPLLMAAAEGASAPRAGNSTVLAQDVRHSLTFDHDNPYSLVTSILRARTAARGVREGISSEMWAQLNSLYLWL